MDTSHVLTLKMSGKQEIRFQVPPKLLGKLIDRPSFLCVWSEFISRPVQLCIQDYMSPRSSYNLCYPRLHTTDSFWTVILLAQLN